VRSLTNTQAGFARRDRLGWLYARRHPSCQAHRSPARAADYLASSALSAVSCFGTALCDSLLPALAFRAFAGIAMPACICLGCGRSRMASKEQPVPASRPVTTSSFTIGASLSFLFGCLNGQEANQKAPNDAKFLPGLSELILSSTGFPADRDIGQAPEFPRHSAAAGRDEVSALFRTIKASDVGRDAGARVWSWRGATM
jgi:hypothetical protein